MSGELRWVSVAQYETRAIQMMWRLSTTVSSFVALQGKVTFKHIAQGVCQFQSTRLRTVGVGEQKKSFCMLTTGMAWVFAQGTPGVLHGSMSYVLQDDEACADLQ